MSFFEKLIHLLEYKVEMPAIFGAYHLICVLLTIAATVLLVWRFKDASDRTIRIILFFFWCTITALEILKQLEGAFYLDGTTPTWSYLWHIFPFQFCSTPYYVIPFAIFMPDGFWRRSFIAFFASFSLFAGLVVMIYPGDVYTTNLFINAQTMILHGSMVAMGVLMVAHNRKHMNKRYFAGSLTVFYSLAAIAILLNELVYNFVLKDVSNQAFNMFVISRHYDCTLPLLSKIYKAVPYGWYLVIYFLGFTLASALIYFSEKGLLFLIGKLKNRKKKA